MVSGWVEKSLNDRLRKYFFKRYIQSQRYAQTVEIRSKCNTNVCLPVDTEFSTGCFKK
jgi:hypothetical protein